MPKPHGTLESHYSGRVKLTRPSNAFVAQSKFDPNYAEAYNNLANALQNLQQIDDAIAAYRQALMLKPGLAEAYTNLGALLVEQGKPDEAIATASSRYRIATAAGCSSQQFGRLPYQVVAAR